MYQLLVCLIIIATTACLTVAIVYGKLALKERKPTDTLNASDSGSVDKFITPIEFEAVATARFRKFVHDHVKRGEHRIYVDQRDAVIRRSAEKVVKELQVTGYNTGILYNNRDEPVLLLVSPPACAGVDKVAAPTVIPPSLPPPAPPSHPTPPPFRRALTLGWGSKWTWLPGLFRSGHGCWFVVWCGVGIYWLCGDCHLKTQPKAQTPT